MIAHKFLSPGGVGLFSDFTWPSPKVWVESSQSVENCVHGIHALRREHLLEWIDDELWEVELDGKILESGGMLVAERGRLIQRVESWDEDAARSFADACARRSAGFAAEALRSAGLADDARSLELTADLPAVQRAAMDALDAVDDAAVAAVVAFAADMVSLVAGSRPDAWGPPIGTTTVVQTAGAIAANAAFVAAHAAGRAAVAASSDERAYEGGFAAERAWQLAQFQAVLR